ncbi:MAG: hypothetical protein CVU41_02590 [Chloroflexi bacterium HGW-Chloroflexi-3]|nr:MAG: hypothetical protein CVU41_02590 [Chloroflexi bacterium HGW-Chloroflexi-3]
MGENDFLGLPPEKWCGSSSPMRITKATCVRWLLFETFVLYAGLLPDSAIPTLIFFLHNNDGSKVISKKEKEGRNVHWVLKLYPFRG